VRAKNLGQGNKGQRNKKADVDSSAKSPLPFRAQMTKSQNDVQAALQLWGDFPDCSPKFCCELDWQHVIMSSLTDVFEQSRLDECDPLVIKALKRKLAITAAACEMWADSIEEETK
jgi:hypothetical protein